MNYKQLKNELDRMQGELSAVRDERDHLIQATKEANASARRYARQCGMVQGQLKSLRAISSRSS
jgi:uncharacterized coiled-coil DUF342 family protein